MIIGTRESDRVEENWISDEDISEENISEDLSEEEFPSRTRKWGRLHSRDFLLDGHLRAGRVGS